jgi:hypothetical protein
MRNQQECQRGKSHYTFPCGNWLRSCHHYAPLPALIVFICLSIVVSIFVALILLIVQLSSISYTFFFFEQFRGFHTWISSLFLFTFDIHQKLELMTTKLNVKNGRPVNFGGAGRFQSESQIFGYKTLSSFCIKS